MTTHDARAAALLRVRGLNVRSTTGRTLVRDLDLDVAVGQTLGVVGESGSGKTMTARAIANALAPGLTSSGSVEFDGLELIGRSERRMRPLRGTHISMVLQDPFTALNPLQTIRQTLRESMPAARRRDKNAARADIDRRLSEVGLDPVTVAEKYPFQLSGGMRQRVAIAAALTADPVMLIADEPTTALDVTTQAEILQLLQNLQRSRGMALILITHDLRVAFSVCDRVLVMYAGSVVESSPAEALGRAPRHPYTAGLLHAEPPVSHYAEQLVAIPGRVPSADSVAGQCAFADRCAWAAPQCTSSRPGLLPVEHDRLSACCRIEEIHADLLSSGSSHAASAARGPAPDREEVLLEVADLRKTFRTTGMIGRAQVTAAVDGVGFHIGVGESLGLLGETGSGKTTIARCLLGLATPDAGSIRLAGFDISNYRKLDRRETRQVRRLVQVVFQDPYACLNPSLTIGAALREAITARGTQAGSGEVEELLELVGLPASYRAARPSALSGGERQRAAIARAIAVRPRLLICDEPVAALDVSVQAQVLEVLRTVRKDYAMSMLFITHDLAVVRQMTDRVIVLRHGEIVESGDTPSALDSPRHPYTIQLVGSAPRDIARAVSADGGESN